MALEYYLICPACKEFIDLYKIRLLTLPAHEHKLPAEGTRISEEEITAGIQNFKETFFSEIPGWIKDLLPFVNSFAEQHAAHHLILKDDYPDPEWYPENPGYTVWKEYRTTHSNELFLPRNLVDDLHITDWSRAETHLKSLNVILYEELELKEYRRTFEELCQKSPDH